MSFCLSGSSMLRELLDDDATRAEFSFDQDLAAMLAFEVALAKAQADVGFITTEAAEHIAQALDRYRPDLDAIAAGLGRDGVAPPVLVSQLRMTLDDRFADQFHRGATSQDLVDTSVMIRMARLVPALSERLRDLSDALTRLGNGDRGNEPLMAHTRMQRALEVTVRDKLLSWSQPLATLVRDTPDYFPLQLGGPEGSLKEMGVHGRAISEGTGSALGLCVPSSCWHTDRQPLLGIAFWATRVCTALGKVGQDVALMSQNEVAQIKLTDGGSSSAMAHKSNPVRAEALVTLARYSSTLMGGLHQAGLHEYERSGAAWALEWLLFPQLMVAAGAALRNADALVASMQFVPEKS